MKNKKQLVLIMLVVALVTFACGRCGTINSDEMGILTESGKITDIVTAGYYFSLDPRAGMTQVNTSAITVEWTDPDELVTYDKQPINLQVAVTVSRTRDRETLEDSYADYNKIMKNDDALVLEVGTRLAPIAKSITVQYTLDEMLGIVDNDEDSSDSGRGELTLAIFKALEPELLEIGIVLRDVRVVNINVDDQYLALLKEKAQATVKKEVAQRQTELKREELKQEQAQTEIDKEKARRARLVQEEQANVYESSPEMLELELARIYGAALQNGTIYFIPAGSDITYLFGADGQVVPVQ
jgi:regulator of protease activity HflC (stomatin/prohibitin superfamily)